MPENWHICVNKGQTYLSLTTGVKVVQIEARTWMKIAQLRPENIIALPSVVFFKRVRRKEQAQVKLET